jgi:Phage integrase, N-terminal SAM-like domain
LPTPAAPPPVPSVPARITIADSCSVFISLREGEKISPATLRKYRTFTKQLVGFAESRGYVMLDQLTSGDVNLFYCGLKLGGRAKAKRLGTLRAFFRFCVNREWLVKSPVSGDLKPPLGSSRVANKIPFTDAELERIIKACDTLGEIRWSSGKGEGVWTGEDAKDFIWTLTYTGLRISDVALFNQPTERRCGEWSGPAVDWARRPANDRVKVMRKPCGKQEPTRVADDGRNLNAESGDLAFFFGIGPSRVWSGAVCGAGGRPVRLPCPRNPSIATLCCASGIRWAEVETEPGWRCPSTERVGH